MRLSERTNGNVVLSFHNPYEQQHVGRVIRPYLGLKGKFKLAVNAVLPPSPFRGDNWRLDSQVKAEQLSDVLDSIDDKSANLVARVAAGDTSARSEELTMEGASTDIRRFLGQVTAELHLEN